MYKRITLEEFIDAFRAHERGNQFSEEGKQALFEHLENLERDTGEQIELDVEGLCREYDESDADEIIDRFGLDDSDCETAADRQDVAARYLENNGALIWRGCDTFLFSRL